ncbi:unnamed protein product [Paramecium primaurelia]|uniref:Uncharacterized protein n=1 Tax=Paramecium primaurelia TaxID=5886 RepID=A0A8S1JNU3_PARPR|nr:unnamed protein product [Paramecium primaurelia]
MKKNCKTKLYSFQITITKKGFLNFKNQYQDQKSKVLEQNQSIKYNQQVNDFTKNQKKNNNNQSEQMKKNTICVSKFDNKLLNSLNQLENLLDKSEKEETPLIFANEDQIKFKYFENNKDDNDKKLQS